MAALPVLQSPARKEALADRFLARGHELGVEAAGAHHPPGAPGPVPEETTYGAEVREGTQAFHGTIDDDTAALEAVVARGEAAVRQRDAGEPTPVPDDYPTRRPWGSYVALVVVGVALVFDITLIEPAWRNFQRLPDAGAWIERFSFPVLACLLIAGLAHGSARAADRAADARTGRARTRAWLLSATFAAALLVPVAVLAGIRTYGEQRRILATGAAPVANAGATFLAVQIFAAVATLGVAHLLHHQRRSAARARHDRHQAEVIARGEAAATALERYREDVEGLLDQLRWAALRGWVALRTALAFHTEDPVAAAAWFERNRDEFRALGLDVTTLADRQAEPPQLPGRFALPGAGPAEGTGGPADDDARVTDAEVVEDGPDGDDAADIDDDLGDDEEPDARQRLLDDLLNPDADAA